MRLLPIRERDVMDEWMRRVEKARQDAIEDAKRGAPTPRGHVKGRR